MKKIFSAFLVLTTIMQAVYSQCGTTNIALNKTVIYSTQDVNHTAAQIVDGNSATDWWPAGGGNQDVQHLIVDLGQNYSVCQVKVYWWDATHIATDFKIQVSTDNITYTDASVITGNTSITTTHTLSNNARYIKVAMTLRAVNWSSYAVREVEINNGTTPPSTTDWSLAGNSSTTPGTHFLGTTDNQRLVFKANNSEKMTILSNGRVGINTASPVSELAVNGTITARKLKITQLNWADFVFEENYKLLRLPQLEAYIKKYKHLPDVPTTKQVAENGTDVAETQAVLLRKIEELTLYLIEQDKKMEQQQKEIEDLKKRLDNN